MKNSKLYSILEHFDKYEQNRCRKYISSPYFNKNKDLSSLYEILIKHINSKSEKELTKEVIWKKLQANKKFDDVRFRKYFSDLLKLIEGFLAQQIYEENPLHKATYLIEAVGDKKMAKLYNSTMKTARRLSNQQPHKAASYYFYQYQIERNYYELTQFDIKRTEKNNIEEIAQNLDKFYLAEKLKYYCLVLTQQSQMSHNYKVLFIDEIINHIKKYGYEDTPSVSIYYQIYLALTKSDNEKYYYKLKDLLEKYSKHFPIEEAASIYTYAINYVTRKLNKGQQHFVEEYFDLYEALLNKRIIIKDGELDPWHYKNIVTIALRIGKFKWTENFITNYKSYLSINYRENAVTFNLARLHWYQKNHNKVIELLREVDYNDVSYNLESKAMLLATYYETEELEALDALLESFRAFLNRHKNIPVNRRKYYKNLIKFTKKLSRIFSNDKEAIAKLKKEVEETPGFKDRWLNEQIAKLE